MSYAEPGLVRRHFQSAATTLDSLSREALKSYAQLRQERLSELAIDGIFLRGLINPLIAVRGVCREPLHGSTGWAIIWLNNLTNTAPRAADITLLKVSYGRSTHFSFLVPHL